MNLINDQFVNDFSEWAEENEDKSAFPSISERTDSYYISRNSEETYMMEYSFETVAAFKTALERYSRSSMDTWLVNKMIVAMYQNRFTSGQNKNIPDEQKEKLSPVDGKSELPEYIYVF